MNLRRTLLTAAVTAAALAVPSSASAQEVIDCGPTFLLGPVECKIESTQQTLNESPPVECRVTFLVGPVMCRVEGAWHTVFDPNNT